MVQRREDFGFTLEARQADRIVLHRRRQSRAFERWDWNSLIADEPQLRGIAAEFMDGSSDFPSRPEMQATLEAFTERAGIRIRYGCRWESTRREETADGDRFVLVTSDGEYRCRFPIFAVGVAEPYSPSTPGIELTAHYADTRDAETYAGKGYTAFVADTRSLEYRAWTAGLSFFF